MNVDDEGRESYEALHRHLEGFWPDRPHEHFTWTLGPVARALPGFQVDRIAPVLHKDPWIYVTLGAWRATQAGNHGTEFFLLARDESPLHVELLSMVANFHADPRHRLGVGSTMAIGRSWADGSKASHLLVSLPHPYGPAFEICRYGDRHVRFLWLVPIHEEEAQLVREVGLDALESRLEQGRADVVSPTRASVV